MFYDALVDKAHKNHGLEYDPFKALVAPRPIGWISTLSKDGIVNLAPYSYFNAVGDNPGVVMFSSANRKDSQTNAEETGEFVCNIVSYELREQMSVSSQHVDANVDEMALAGLEPAPCRLVSPPRVKAAPAALECKYIQSVELPDGKGGKHTNVVIFGLVVGIHIDDKFIKDGQIDVELYKPIARLGYRDYAAVEKVFAMEWQASRAKV